MAISMYWNRNPRRPTDRERDIIRLLKQAIRTPSKAISEVNRIMFEAVDQRPLGADWRECLEAVRVAIQDEDSLAVDETRESRSDIQIFFQEMERILAQRDIP